MKNTQNYYFPSKSELTMAGFPETKEETTHWTNSFVIHIVKINLSNIHFNITCHYLKMLEISVNELTEINDM